MVNNMKFVLPFMNIVSAAYRTHNRTYCKRYYARWVHRKPVRAVFPQDEPNQEQSLTKLNIERGTFINGLMNERKQKSEMKQQPFQDSIYNPNEAEEIDPVHVPKTSTNDEKTAINKKKSASMQNVEIPYVVTDETRANKNKESVTTEFINEEKHELGMRELQNIQHPSDVLDTETLHMPKSRKFNRKTTINKTKSALMTMLGRSFVITDQMKNSAEKLGIPTFVKLHEDDPILSNVVIAAKKSEKKNKRDIILLEGKRLIQDSIEAGFIPQMIFFSRVNDIKELSIPSDGVKLYKVPYKTLSLWSALTTNPGIMGIAKVPETDKKKPNQGHLPITVVVDNVRDPGNLGSILRAAAGAGCQKVILTKGCVDVWDAKVLRSGMGAHFRVPIHVNINWNEMDDFLEDDCGIFLADNRKNSRSQQENSISNEGLMDDEILKNSNSNMNSNKLEMTEESHTVFPIVPYYTVDFTSEKSLTLVVGSETQGLSSNALHLMCKRKGVRLTVPLSNNVESLNAGTALGIIIFEMKRQFVKSLS